MKIIELHREVKQTLTKDKWCKYYYGRIDNEGVKHCLIGHIYTQFPYDHNVMGMYFCILRDKCKRDLIEFNDDPKTTYESVIDLLNSVDEVINEFDRVP